jgi:hypothetical protein
MLRSGEFPHRHAPPPSSPGGSSSERKTQNAEGRNVGRARTEQILARQSYIVNRKSK